MRNRIIQYFFTGLLLAGCNAPENQTSQASATNLYFDVAGFVQEQVQLLNQEKPTAVKQVVENGQPTESKILKSLNWQKELESFAELDINKPAFRNSYETVKTNSVGLTTVMYRRKPEGEGDILSLAVTTDAQQQVRKIQAIRENENVLINTRQQMQLHCDTKTGKTRVSSYRIEGMQQPVIFDGLQYVIFTQIR